MRLQQEPCKELSSIIAFLKEVISNQSLVLTDNAEFFFKDFISGFSQTLAQLIKIKLSKPEFRNLLECIPELLGKIMVNNISNAELIESLKFFFDNKSRIYQYHMLSDENAILIQYSINSMPQVEKEWRESLQYGDRVDAIKIDPEQKGARAWSKGVIRESKEGRIKVTFQNDTKMSDREFSIYSQDLNRENTTAAQVDDWRNLVKSGDKVDCFDSTGYWYASTVLDIQERDYQKENIQMIKIAFRVSHPDGDKKDLQGSPFFGWDKDYDEWLPLYSARVAPYQMYTKDSLEDQTSARQNNNNNTKGATLDTKVDDQMDLMISNDQIFAVQRKQCRSDLLVNFINTIGQNGGFDKILEKIVKGDLNLVYAYVNCIGKCAANYHRRFVDEYFPKFEQAVRQKILNATATEIRNFKKEQLDEILDQLFQVILSRMSSRDQNELNCERNIFTIEIGELFMRQNFLERRIDGVRLISEVCKNCLSILDSKPSALLVNGSIKHEKKIKMVDQIAKKINEQQNIMMEIFQKNRTHSQLVQRSEKLIRLLMARGLFSEQNEETVWNASENNDGDLRAEIHKVLTGAAADMQMSHRLFFLTKISSVAEEDLNDRHIELITQICTTIRIPSEQPQAIEIGLQLLWKIATESSAGMLIINRATMGFSNILSKQQVDQKLEYIDKLAENVKQMKPMGYLTIKIMANLFRSSFEDGSQIQNLNQLIDYLEGKHNLQQSLFEEFQNYMERVRSEVSKQGLKGKEISNIAVVDLFMHEDQVAQRLEFIKFYCNIQSSVNLTSENLTILWTQLVTKSLDDNDSKLMYIWLREVCDQLMQTNGTSMINIDDMIKFYHQTMDIKSNEADEFKWLSIQGFHCIQSFFVLINSVQKKILKITPDHGVYQSTNPIQENQSDVMKNVKKKFSSYNNETGAKYTSYSFNNEGTQTQNETPSVIGPQNQVFSNIENVKKDNDDPNELEIQSLVPPKELDGYNIMWRIATESTSKMVIDSAAKLLIQMHHEVSDSLRGQIPQFDKDFIDQCFNIIDNQKPAIALRTDEQNQDIEDKIKCLPIYATTIQKLRVFLVEERKIIRSLFLLRQLIRASEKTGTYSLKPHLSLSLGVQLGCIQVQNNITGEKNGYLKRLEVSIDSHSTVWDLKKLIGQKVMQSETDSSLPNSPVHPALIRLFQMSTSQDLNDPRNGTTLSELKFKPNESIGAFLKRVDLQRKAPIVQDIQGQVTLTEKAIKVAQEIFAKFVDVEKDGEKLMTKQACNKFQAKWIGFGVKGTLADSQANQIASMLLSSSAEGKQSLDECKVSFSKFEQFIINQCLNNQDDQLRVGLKNLGYAQDLSELPQDGEDDNILQIRKSKEDMPRYQVANNEQQFDTLLQLLDLNREVEIRATEMIQMLVTNPKLYHSVLSIGEKDDFQWSKIFDQNNEHKMLYTLEIIEAILVRDQHNQTTLNWMNKFVELKGFEQLQNMLIEALKNIHKSIKSKKYVQQLFKIIRLLVIGSQVNEKEELIIVQDFQPSSEENEQYSTPKKQIKHHTEIVSAFDGQITQEFLFGGEDEREEKPLPKLLPKADSSVQAQKDDHLQKVLQQNGLGKAILERVNITSLQDQVVKVVSIILQEQEVKVDERLMIESAMSLWSALLSNSVSQVPLTIDSEFLKVGLLKCNDQKVRECFCKTFKTICKAQPQINDQVLEILKLQMKEISLYEKTQDYFNLFESILSQYLKIQKNERTLTLIIETLKLHETKETRQSNFVDTTLEGIFKLVWTYIIEFKENKQVIVQIFAQNNFVDQLFSECLFSGKQINKCITSRSRKSGFMVLESFLAYLEPHKMVEFIQNYIKPLIKDVERPKKWRHSPSSKGRVNEHVGIVNLGCICYMNSMLQQFFMVPQFRYQLLKAIDKNPENLVSYKDDVIDDNLLKQLQKLFGFLELSDRHAFDPKDFCFTFKDFDGTPTKISEQKDSQEFLNIFCDRVEFLLKDTSQRNLMKDVFSGNQCSQLICQSCGKVKNRIELFYNLSLQVKDCTGIYDSLGKLVKGQTIEDYHCEGCNKKVNVTKRSLLADMPNVLIVHLQRIVFCFDTLMNDKVNSRFEFPNVLDLRQFSFKETMKDQESQEDEMQKLMNIDDDDYIYRLVGVNIHVGTADHGHYYSIINTNRGVNEQDPYINEHAWKKVELDPWMVYDDATIRSFGFNLDMKKEAFGGDQSSNATAATSDAMDDKELTSFLASGSQTYGKSAYMLIYERKSKKDLHEFSENGDQQLDQKVIPYRSVPKFVPDWIKDVVQSDNKNFTTDSQLFNEDFMSLMRSMFKVIGGDIVMTAHRYDYAYQKHFDLLKHEALQLSSTVMFDMLSYYDKNSVLSNIASDAASIITFCDSELALIRGQNSIVAQFAEKLYIEDKCSHLLYIMFTCTDSTARNSIGVFTSRVIKRLIDLYAAVDHDQRETLEPVKQVYIVIEKFINKVFSSLKEKECLKNWVRLECYFQMLHKIGTSSLTAIQLLLERSDIISDLIDFMLGNKSPRAQIEREVRTAMGGTFPPPFSPLYTFVSTLIRMTHTSSMDLESRLDTHKDFKMSSLEAHKSYFLSQEAYIMLTKTEFLEKIIFDNKYTEVEEFSKALGHLCYKDLKFTRKFAKKVLKAISYSNNDDVSRLLVIVSQLATIKDEYQKTRLEYLFGFAYIMHINQNGDIQYGSPNIGKKKFEEVYQISSGVDARNHDDALLSLLWKYKGRMDSFTLTCLQSLGELLVLDEVVADYFSELPAPNYNMLRYTDWINPYLVNQLQDAQKYKEASGTDEKIAQINKIQSLFKQYDEFLQNKQVEPSFIIVETREQKEVKNIDIDDVLQLQVTQIACKWIESKPTGTGNLNLPDSSQLNSKLCDEEVPQEEEENQEPEPKVQEPNVCDNLLFRVTLTNNHSQALRFKLNFSGLSEQELIWPQGGIKDFIRPGITAHLLTLRRKSATNPMTFDLAENLNLHLVYKIHPGSDFEMSQYASQQDKPKLQEAPKQPEQKRDLGQEIREQRRNGISVETLLVEPEKSVESDDYSQKACPVCTLLNDFDATVCDVCGSTFS